MQGPAPCVRRVLGAKSAPVDSVLPCRGARPLACGASSAQRARLRDAPHARGRAPRCDPSRPAWGHGRVAAQPLQQSAFQRDYSSPFTRARIICLVCTLRLFRPGFCERACTSYDLSVLEVEDWASYWGRRGTCSGRIPQARSLRRGRARSKHPDARTQLPLAQDEFHLIGGHF